MQEEATQDHGVRLGSDQEVDLRCDQDAVGAFVGQALDRSLKDIPCGTRQATLKEVGTRVGDASTLVVSLKRLWRSRALNDCADLTRAIVQKQLDDKLRKLTTGCGGSPSVKDKEVSSTKAAAKAVKAVKDKEVSTKAVEKGVKSKRKDEEAAKAKAAAQKKMKSEKSAKTKAKEANTKMEKSANGVEKAGKVDAAAVRAKAAVEKKQKAAKTAAAKETAAKAKAKASRRRKQPRQMPSKPRRKRRKR